jgi:hypothetical protein
MGSAFDCGVGCSATKQGPRSFIPDASTGYPRCGRSRQERGLSGNTARVPHAEGPLWIGDRTVSDVSERPILTQCGHPRQAICAPESRQLQGRPAIQAASLTSWAWVTRTIRVLEVGLVADSFADRIGRVSLARPDRLGLPLRGVARGLPLHLGVQLRPKQHDNDGQPHPGHKTHSRP